MAVQSSTIGCHSGAVRHADGQMYYNCTYQGKAPIQARTLRGRWLRPVPHEELLSEALEGVPPTGAGGARVLPGPGLIRHVLLRIVPVAIPRG